MRMPAAGRCGRGRAPAGLGLLLVHGSWLEEHARRWAPACVVFLSLEAGRGTLPVSLPGTGEEWQCSEAVLTRACELTPLCWQRPDHFTEMLVRVAVVPEES